jgi:hypothetical protein
MKQSRLADLRQFYDLLLQLENKLGGKRILADSVALDHLPQRGVYFFFEPGELRSDSDTGLRVVRVGTHALVTAGKRTLRDRLSTHRGTLHNGGGNHRGSVFRKITGEALIRRDPWDPAVAGHWGIGNHASSEITKAELPLEQAVSQIIRRMPFLWLPVLDAPGPESLRGYIERNSIALLSNYLYAESNWIDSPSIAWLGLFHPNQKIRRSGLWNSNHVDQEYEPRFLEVFEKLLLV